MADTDHIDEDYLEVKKVQEGDNSAFDLLMQKHQTTIGKQMRRFSLDSNIVEELTQTVFITAYQSIENYKPLAPFIHWLRRIASRVGYNFWRDEAKKPSTVRLEDWDRPTYADTISVKPDAAHLLDLVLKRLPPKERQVLCMMYLDNMNAKDIAQTMGWTVAMVKMRAYRSRKKLRTLLNDKELGDLLNEYR